MKKRVKEGMKDLLAMENVFAYTRLALRKRCPSGPCSRPRFEAWNTKFVTTEREFDTMTFIYPSGGSHPRAHILPGAASSGR
jgi:hypothetical protein